KPAAAGPKPTTSWRGFLFFSLGFAAFEAALEQGERLNWLDSGTIVALLVMGGLFFVLGVVQRWLRPNPFVNLRFLPHRIPLILLGRLFSLRFILLGILIVIPGYLGAVQGFRPEQTGTVLLYLAAPILLFGMVATRVMRRVENRVVAALGFA